MLKGEGDPEARTHLDYFGQLRSRIYAFGGERGETDPELRSRVDYFRELGIAQIHAEGRGRGKTLIPRMKGRYDYFGELRPRTPALGGKWGEADPEVRTYLDHFDPLRPKFHAEAG